MISTRTPCGTPMTTMVTVPPSTPDLVCWTALVTISEVSKVAASWSAPTWCELSVRATKALALATCSGRPGRVSEPRTVARVPPAVPRGPDPRCGPDHDRRELPSGVSMLSPSKLLQVVISPVRKSVSESSVCRKWHTCHYGLRTSADNHFDHRQTYRSPPCRSDGLNLRRNAVYSPSVICPDLHLLGRSRGASTKPMMEPRAHTAQVREGNFPAEIPDGISSATIVRYRTACQGGRGVRRLHSGARIGSHPVLRELPDR